MTKFIRSKTDEYGHYDDQTLVANPKHCRLDFLVFLNDEHLFNLQLVGDFLQLGFGLTCLIHYLNQVFPQPQILGLSGLCP